MTTTIAQPVRDLACEGRLSRQRIVELMRPPAAIISARMPLHEALAMMVRLRARHAVAVDGKGRCVGVLADRAIVVSWAGSHYPLREQTVASALDRPPAVVPTRSVVAEVARFMADNRVDAVAVADPYGHPVGIVTGADLVALLTGDANSLERR